MEIVRKLGVVLGWAFIAVIVVGAFYLMYFIGRTYFETEENYIKLTVESEQRAKELNRIFGDFPYQSESKAIVVDERLREGEEGEDAYAEILIEEQGQLPDIYNKYNKRLLNEGYESYAGDLGSYYSSTYNDSDRKLFLKYNNANNEAIVLEFSMEQNNTCNEQTKCSYLPNIRTSGAEPITDLTDVPINGVKVLNVRESSSFANIDR